MSALLHLFPTLLAAHHGTGQSDAQAPSRDLGWQRSGHQRVGQEEKRSFSSKEPVVSCSIFHPSFVSFPWGLAVHSTSVPFLRQVYLNKGFQFLNFE